MKTKHKIIIGDSRLMRELSDESANLIITSPPYWQLKDYGSDNQKPLANGANIIFLTLNQKSILLN